MIQIHKKLVNEHFDQQNSAKMTQKEYELLSLWWAAQHTKENHKYKRNQSNPRKCLGKKYDPHQRLKKIHSKSKKRSLNDRCFDDPNPKKRRKLIARDGNISSELDEYDKDVNHCTTEQEMIAQYEPNDDDDTVANIYCSDAQTTQRRSQRLKCKQKHDYFESST
eukprot:525773_1